MNYVRYAPDSLLAARLDLFGDPVVSCTRESTFYYASLATDRPRSGGGVTLTGIALSKSEDSGQNFEGATMAVAKDASTHLLDKPWMTVVPGSTTGADIIHLTYTDFDSSRSSKNGSSATRQLKRGFSFLSQKAAGGKEP